MFPNALFGVPSEGKQGTVSFNLANNLEMKVKSSNDSIGEKKISLIENLSISQSYNMAADSLRWSDINASILLRLTKGFNLNLNTTWDVYTYALNDAGAPVRVNKLRIASGKGLGRLRNTGTSFSYTFNNDTFKKKKDKKKDNNKGDDESDGFDETSDDRRGGHNHDDGQELVMGNDGYAKWEVPWSLTLNYSVNYSYGAFNKQIRPTQNWNFSFSASYNFDTGRLAYMNCNISRDLHCFQMSASFVPVGPYKSYNFHIAVKSSLLSDLKYDKRSSTSNGITWY